MKTVLSIALICALGMTLLAPVTVAEDESLKDQAFKALVQADRDAKAGDQAKAIAGYTEALRLYQELCEKHPEEKTTLIEYRMRYCEKKIEEAKTQ
jgi:hypothetical protein